MDCSGLWRTREYSEFSQQKEKTFTAQVFVSGLHLWGDWIVISSNREHSGHKPGSSRVRFSRTRGCVGNNFKSPLKIPALIEFEFPGSNEPIPPPPPHMLLFQTEPEF